MNESAKQSINYAFNFGLCLFVFVYVLCLSFQLIPELTHLAIADMGQLPVGLLTPFRQLRYLNISGNSLDNMALQVIDPCRQLEVSQSRLLFLPLAA